MASQREQRSGPVRFPPPLIYLAGFGLGVVVEVLAPSPQPAAWLRVVGAAAGLAILIALDSAAMARFARAGTPFNPSRPARALVTDGPYRMTRNPMYVGLAGLYVGAAVAVGVLWALAFLPVVLVVVDRVVITREERHLEAAFGAEYERYRSRVRRWL
jgi:protein-S-isoprenylcysteine O-methyltransferase Ste14